MRSFNPHFLVYFPGHMDILKSKQSGKMPQRERGGSKKSEKQQREHQGQRKRMRRRWSMAPEHIFPAVCVRAHTRATQDQIFLTGSTAHGEPKPGQRKSIRQKWATGRNHYMLIITQMPPVLSRESKGVWNEGVNLSLSKSRWRCYFNVRHFLFSTIQISNYI